VREILDFPALIDDTHLLGAPMAHLKAVKTKVSREVLMQASE